ncbi:unnamed protein product [Rhizophagus irregularis]|nr:unnamed protein product [Rhizophagus irregularis]
MPNLSFQYKGKDRLVSGGDKILNDFEYPSKPKTLSDFETETSEKSDSYYAPPEKKIRKPEGVVMCK